MRVGITCYHTYGGSGTIATELGIALAARGHEVHFIAYQQPFRLPVLLPRIYFHQVDVSRYPLSDFPPYDLALAVLMRDIVQTHRLEILHVHYAIPHATSAWLAREMLREDGSDVRIVTTLHGTDVTLIGYDPSFHAIAKFSIERSDGITAVSHYLQQETYKAFGCASNVEVIHNFIDPNIYDRTRYPVSLREKFGVHRCVLIHVSNFRPIKRVRDVVRIFSLVQRELPSALVMIGDGPDLASAQQEARVLGVSDCTFFLGKLDVVAPFLACGDLFLLPSQNESFGLSALEALACGIPVVASRVGGLLEVGRRRRHRCFA